MITPWLQKPDSLDCNWVSHKNVKNDPEGPPSSTEQMIVLQRGVLPGPSCVSCMSDASKDLYFDFKGESSSSKEIIQQQNLDLPDPSCASCKTDTSKEVVIFFKGNLDDGKQLGNEPLPESTEHFDKVTVNQHNDHIPKDAVAARCERKLKYSLKIRFHCVSEGMDKLGNPIPLKQIYTDLYITHAETCEANEEHEFRYIDTVSRKQKGEEVTITLEQLFKESPGLNNPHRMVTTRGVAGIGKTLLTQKLTLDWVENKTNQEIQFIFPFTFRELNLLKGKQFSLVELIHHFFNETNKICGFEEFKILFIFDGLDECRLPLDFSNNEILTEVTKSTSVDVLLTNLIRGNLLPTARVWITTRPAAANRIPPDYVDMVTEVRGFTDLQKEEYLKKRFRDEGLSSKIISHIKTSRTLYIMCHIPIFCWIIATVLENVFKNSLTKELPKTMTEMYVHYLLVQTKVKTVKYDEEEETDHWSPKSRKMLESLGKLAFEQLQKGNLIFYESDLRECQISIQDASKYSGMFTQIFKVERVLCDEKLFSFVHLSVQEFLAALHVHLTFTNQGVNLLKEKNPSKLSMFFRKPKILSFYQKAVDETLQSPNGHLDLFLRFLLGLSLDTNQKFLQGLLTQTEIGSQINQETVQYIKDKINENQSAEKNIHLFHCLNELNDDSLVQEIQQFLSAGGLCTEKLSPAQWSALVFLLLSSDENLDVFDLNRFSVSEEVFLRLLPVVKASKKVVLTFCVLSQSSFEALSSALSTKSCSLEILDLSNNNVQDSGTKQIAEGLKSPNCTLQTLRMSGCSLTERSIDILHPPHSSLISRLTELDLSNNILQDSSVNMLSEGLRCPPCQLKTLRLNLCCLSQTSCGPLSAILSSESASLKELDLSNNNLQDSGVKVLSLGLQSSYCKLETLRLSGCVITGDGVASLASALNIKSSQLRELDLSYNHPGDSGVKLLSATLTDPTSKLETLRIDPAGVKWLRPGLKKYCCALTINTNSMNRNVKLSDGNTKASYVKEAQSYPEHPDRFDKNHQVMCSTGLTGRCYWEVELMGGVHTSVSYKGITRREEGNDGWFGGNEESWTLFYDGSSYSIWHNKKGISIPHATMTASASQPHRMAVYLDWPAGTLSFYRVSLDSLTHIHTFHTTFTEALYPGFGFWSWLNVPLDSSVRLICL